MQEQSTETRWGAGRRYKDGRKSKTLSTSWGNESTPTTTDLSDNLEGRKARPDSKGIPKRKFLVRANSAYRTASSQAVIACVTRMQLLVKERRSLYYNNTAGIRLTKEGARDCAIQKQNSWIATIGDAQWSRQLIPRIEDWVKSEHWSVGYHLAQALTGHSSFNSYTKWIGQTNNDSCKYCYNTDTGRHSVFECKDGKQKFSLEAWEHVGPHGR